MKLSVYRLLLAMSATILLSACASSGSSINDGLAGARQAGNGGHASICKSGDTQVDSSGQCLQDDAACYELNNGKWCTGERGNTCPAGSSALPAGIPCAPGKRCFHVGESLECTIN